MYAVNTKVMVRAIRLDDHIGDSIELIRSHWFHRRTRDFTELYSHFYHN